jgi:hypothetical protein
MSTFDVLKLESTYHLPGKIPLSEAAMERLQATFRHPRQSPLVRCIGSGVPVT